MRTGSYATREREQTIVELSRVGVPLDTIRAALRDARTLARLAEAQCNGDWPCDNGQREVQKCLRCQGLYAPAVLKRQTRRSEFRVCPDCRAESRLRVQLSPYGRPDFSGDPRGFVVRLVVLVDGREREIGIA